MKKNMILTRMDLRLFDAGAAASAGNGGDAAEGAQEAQNSQQQTATEGDVAKPADDAKASPVDEAARRAAFEQYKKDNKDLFDENVQQIINKRFKSAKQTEERMESLKPLLEMVAGKYGVEATDVEHLMQAIADDDSYYEEEALQKGITVEQLKQMKKLERENAALKRTQDEVEREQQTRETLAKWVAQAEEAKKQFPALDLNVEAQHPETGERFRALLQNGVSVEAAYKVIHMDEIMSGAMAYTAKVVQEKTVNDIRSRGMRPDENGASKATAPAVVRTDVSKMSQKDREALSKRVLEGGERIVL